MNPIKTFDFSEKNISIVKKMFASVEDPQQVFFPINASYPKQIKLFVSILLQGLEFSDLMPEDSVNGSQEEALELKCMIEFYKEIETTFTLYLEILED